MAQADGEDTNTVVPLVTEHGVYAAGYGVLCRLDPENGKILASTTLPVHKEPASRKEAPSKVALALANRSLLIASSNRRVLGLHPITLTQLWMVKLPKHDSFHPLLALLCHVPAVDSSAVRIYAAPAGYVFRLDPLTGKTLAKSSLPGSGTQPVSLAIMAPKDDVLATTFNRFYPLDPFTLKTRYELGYKSFGPGSSRTNPTVIGSLCGSDGTGEAYAAFMGFLYHIGTLKGKVLTKVPLNATQDVRMVLDAPNERIYIGQNGYAICVSTERGNLTKLWRTSLPGSGYSATQVALGHKEGTAYFANNGFLFLLDRDGKVLSNALQGFGGMTTNLATSVNKVVVGVDGHCGAFDTGEPAAAFPSYAEAENQRNVDEEAWDEFFDC